MSLFGGSNQGLRAQVPHPGGSRWVWIVGGSAVVILAATYVLAPYLPGSPKPAEEKKTQPVMTQASHGVMDAAEWGYTAVMPTIPESAPVERNGQAPMTAPAHTPAPSPAATYTPAPTPMMSEQDRRRLAEEAKRRRKAERQEYEQEIKKWKPLTWGKSSEKVEVGQVIKAANYSLSPGELIPCETEPILSNEAPGAFRAFVTSHVYDSKTHRHIIVPQGTELNLQVGGKTIIFGDSRLPIEALTLKFPDGDWLKFGKVSIGDRYGTPGFTGEINRHLWRIIGAIFVNSVLRGGSTAMVANSYDEGVTDRMQSAAVAETAREGQQLSKQVLRTDPTITVAAVYGCYVLLEEPITRSQPYQLVSAPGR